MKEMKGKRQRTHIKDKLRLVVADQVHSSHPRFANSLNYALFGFEGLSGLANFVQRCNAHVVGNGNTVFDVLPAPHI